MLADEIAKICRDKVVETQKNKIKWRFAIFHHRSTTNKSLFKENESGGESPKSPKSPFWLKIKPNPLKTTQMQQLQLQQIKNRRHSKSWCKLPDF